MNPKVTVCIPTYNRASFLEEAIQSVLAQTLTEFTLLVADDASTDTTPTLVTSFHDPRIQYFRQPQNVGIMANHRTAIEMVNTEFVAIVCDDDILLPDHLASAIEALARYPQAAYYSGPMITFGAGLQKIWHPAGITDTNPLLTYFSPGQAVKFLAMENPGFINTMVCRRDRFTANIFWGKPGYVHTDVLVLTQLMAQGGFLYSSQPTLRYRYHDTNASRSPADKRYALKLHCMLWFAIRYLAQFLLDHHLCSPQDIQQHGLTIDPSHTASLLFGLASFYSSPVLFSLAKSIFTQRTELDQFSKRTRLARRFGFTLMPIFEQISLFQSGWWP